jgi:hypothetical protein
VSTQHVKEALTAYREATAGERYQITQGLDLIDIGVFDQPSEPIRPPKKAARKPARRAKAQAKKKPARKKPVRLDEAQKKDILRLASQGWTPVRLSIKFGVSVATVLRVLNAIKNQDLPLNGPVETRSVEPDDTVAFVEEPTETRE